MNQDRDIFTVSRLNSEVRMTIERSFPLIWVQGEISNFMRPRSGHLYFSLKDEHSQCRCAMFKGKQRQLRFNPKDGDQVIARVRLGLYEPRGDFQLIVEHLEPAGEGAINLAFEALKKKLSAEHLFDTDRKKPLPALPKCIGVITSPTGAAIRDVLHILKRRFPSIPVIIYPVLVQGNTAAASIETMLKTVNQRNECDVIILTRGGGSLEDLNAFNDEQLARTIAASEIPLISAVGHEIDFTIADFVADKRAPTPSAAAEICTPDSLAIEQQFSEREHRLHFYLQQQIEKHYKKTEHLKHRLKLLHPSQELQQQQQRVDQLSMRIESLLKTHLDKNALKYQILSTRLHAKSPQLQLVQFYNDLNHYKKQLSSVILQQMTNHRNQCSMLAHQLHTASPLATMSRGYSITKNQDTGSIIRNINDLKKDNVIETTINNGRIISKVLKTSKT